MKKILLIFFIPLYIFSQGVPYDFHLNKSKKVYKISDGVPRSNTIEDILIQDNTIWLGTSRGLSKSTDDGNTWTNYYMDYNFGNEKVSKVGYYDGVIYAATWHFTNVYGQNMVEGSGIRYSTDDGDTWTKIDQPVDALSDSVVTYGINKLKALPVTTTINNMPYDIAFTKNTIWMAAFAGGLRKSTDMGKTWQRVVLPPDYLDSINPNDTLSFELSPASGNLGFEENLNHRVFSVLAVNDSLIYVGTSGGINRSTDGGVSWVKFNHQNQSSPISGNFIVALDYDDYTNTVWAATWQAVDLNEYWAASASSDGGQTWSTYLPASKIQSFGFKYDYNGNQKNGSQIFAATDNGVFRTTNAGGTWYANPLISDSETGVTLQNNSFRDVAANHKADGTTDIWFGSLGGLAKLNESPTGFWDGTWTVFISSEKLNSSVQAFAFPNPFSPDDENVTIQYSTNGKDADVTIRIFDYGMNLVRTLIQNAPRTGAINDLKDIWDGRDENGDIVANGVYFYRIDIGSGDPIFGKIIVLM